MPSDWLFHFHVQNHIREYIRCLRFLDWTRNRFPLSRIYFDAAVNEWKSVKSEH